jgi:hypothetical protein
VEEEEKLAETAAAAEAQGLKWEDLTPEQKASLYRDYTGEEAVNAADFQEGGRLMMIEPRRGVQAGRVFASQSPLSTLGDVLRAGAGAVGKKRARGRMEDLSKQKAQALEIAGGLAQGAQERQMARADANRAADRNAMLKIAQARQQPLVSAPAQPAPIGPQATQAGPGTGTPPPPAFGTSGVPMRAGAPGAPPANMPGKQPGTPQEWMAYMMRTPVGR